MMSGTISAIMVSWRTGPVLIDAIKAVLADDAIGELILVDHDNPEHHREQVDALARSESRLKILRTDANLGFARGCNLGARQAVGEWLFFINPDAEPEPGCAGKLAAALADEPETALAGARVLNSDGSEQRGSRRRELTLWRAIASFSGLARLGLAKSFGMEHEAVPADPAEVAAISGAAFLVRRSGFDVLGGFDETFFLHVEDIDLCRRAERVWFVPGAVVHHVGSSSDAHPIAVEWEKAKGFFRYFWKFGGAGDRLILLLVTPILFAAILGRALWRQVRSG
ncbi:glycosyltransferase family 2 protein [Hyphobacterium sp.]|uniref:glycosyltransferase family 2 protein n=1 Tax=Hyphobacterium sp. TaxID=2004662 RepID=UPI003B51776D